jgi:Fe2+ or Zn2+ uptake regulation protein
MTDEEHPRRSGGEFEAKVGDEELLEVFREAETPVLTASMAADRLPIGRQAVYERLQKLEEQGRIDRLKVGGRAVVWWPTEDNE